MPRLSLAKLERHLYAAADRLRQEGFDAAGPAFEPFGHKLVRRTMTDYLERIAAAKGDIARLKGEKEAFEQNNAPDDLDEEELAAWNYARDLEHQVRELKAEHKDALKQLAILEKQAAKPSPSRRSRREEAHSISGERSQSLLTSGATEKLTALRAKFQPVLHQLPALETALVPCEQIKEQLAEARARYGMLTDEFVDDSSPAAAR